MVLTAAVNDAAARLGTEPAISGSDGGIVLAQDRTLADLVNTVARLESEIRRLNGRIDELTYQQQQDRARVDRALNDIEYRLDTLDGGGGGGGGGGIDLPLAPGVDGSGAITPEDSGLPLAPDAVISGDSGSLAPGGGGGTDPIGNVILDTGPQVLGTLTTTPDGAVTGATDNVIVSPPNGVAAEYDQAFAMVQRADYGGAEAAFASFLSRHPNHELASNAYYWLGETYYVRGQFEQARDTFARGYQSFPTGNKAVESLLRLGMTLAQTGDRANACLTFAQLGQQFPNAALAVQRRAQQERQRLACN